VSKRKRRWSREFKEAAVARMGSAETIYGLAAELGVRRELLFKWRRTYEAGGSVALRVAGGSPATPPPPEPTPPPAVIPVDLAAAQRRIEELERKIGQQQLDLDFFHAALRRVGEQQPRKGAPGGTTSTR
jgi:transposase-like protein